MASVDAPRDANFIAAALFAKSSAPREVMPGQIDADTGRILVSSSGGGGVTTLAATETPNGMLTVFTFSTATAQPSFIVADNTMTRATTASGAVNWTWSSGLKQATLTVPPVEEIFGIV